MVRKNEIPSWLRFLIGMNVIKRSQFISQILQLSVVGFQFPCNFDFQSKLKQVRFVVHQFLLDYDTHLCRDTFFCLPRREKKNIPKYSQHKKTAHFVEVTHSSQIAKTIADEIANKAIDTLFPSFIFIRCSFHQTWLCVY